MTRDGLESFLNAAFGVAVSLAITAALRAAGRWDAPVWEITGWYFAASWVRARVLRWVFRRVE